MNKAVLRFRDGRVLKGSMLHFRPNAEHIRFRVEETGNLEMTKLSDLKAVFFVKDFDGCAEYQEEKLFGLEKGYGRKTIVHFEDGEELWGFTQGYDASRLGFFLFPSDGSSNNERVYVVNSYTQDVRFAA